MTKVTKGLFGSRKLRRSQHLGRSMSVEEATVDVFRIFVPIEIGGRISEYGPLSAYHYSDQYKDINDLVRDRMTCITDICDEVDNFHSGMVCGFLDDMSRDMWFDILVCVRLEEAGFKVGKYSVPDSSLLRGEYQVAYHPDSVKHKEVMTISEYIENYASESDNEIFKTRKERLAGLKGNDELRKPSRLTC